MKDKDHYIATINNRIDSCHELLKIQASVITDEYMKGMYNGMELILCTLEDRKPIWASELDTNQREKGNPFLYVYATQQDRKITVKKTERIVSQDGKSSKYLIYAEDGVYENTDNILRMKFNSADVYGQLQNGKTYMCDTYGWRVPFLSIYPNIVKCEENNK